MVPICNDRITLALYMPHLMLPESYSDAWLKLMPALYTPSPGTTSAPRPSSSSSFTMVCSARFNYEVESSEPMPVLCTPLRGTSATPRLLSSGFWFI